MFFEIWKNVKYVFSNTAKNVSLTLVSQHQAHHGFEDILSQSVTWLQETELLNSCDCCLFLFHSRRSISKID